ncbi:hypothetical protein AK830_g4421 [Neonectria ditissima]|uniref:Uncharacterized protein n=1 Tax=Neonectria ditissima TaxID=78410 RepID=A0A0P7BG78_9HYPO|nr:hypothetical protein AK830_g4421 [Neonectria ditissima]
MPTPEQLRQRFLANPVLQPQEDVAIGASQPTIQPAMGSVIDFVPVLDPKVFDHLDLSPADMGHQLPHLFPFHSVCKNGPLSAIHSMVTSESRTVAFLHHALTVALKAGNVDAAHYLLDSGAPIGRKTPDCILQAPADRQVPLFDLLAHHGWDVNTRGYDGNVLLPFVITNLDVLRWFLTHGANPNLGVHPNRPDSTVSGPSTESCNTLQLAAAHSTVEAVQMLLDAGAQIGYGTPLHSAAGVCEESSGPRRGRVKSGKEFDEGRIPVMDLLVARGADINQAMDTPYLEPLYPITCAVIAGAVERVRWLLDHGANPHMRGWHMIAAEAAANMGSDEMKSVMAEGLATRKWVESGTEQA